jgi:hypothetical protein
MRYQKIIVDTEETIDKIQNSLMAETVKKRECPQPDKEQVKVKGEEDTAIHDNIGEPEYIMLSETIHTEKEKKNTA